MLREDVVEAVGNGEFSVWGVQDIDEAITIMTGVAADTVNASVEEKLVRYATLRREFSHRQEAHEQQ
jgi:predicted ATP-dependent protease